MSVFVISDVHGNYTGLIKALKKHALIDKHGNRQLPRKHKIISIGDLINGSKNSIEGDHACLDLIPDVIDYLVVGNHEIPYFDSGNYFNNFHHYERMHERLHDLNKHDKIVPAVLTGKTLISHAGVSKQFVWSDDMNEREIWASLDYHWRAFDYNFSLFSAIGYERGGSNKCGGILWCDFDLEFVPTNFQQIVGHTSRNRRVQMKQNAICIDVGAKDVQNKPFILEVQ